ncbi:MAG: PEPxxWA-CTERM sorting domain-containing protein, partial [Polymorphobacter sp.]
LQGFPSYNSGGAFGGAFEAYSQRDWSLSAAVPEPASWALMITGFGLVGSAQRLAARRRRVAATA